jgi:hypothetical protein
MVMIQSVPLYHSSSFTVCQRTGLGIRLTGPIAALNCFRRNRFDFREIFADLPLCDLNVVVGLQVQPKFWPSAEGFRKAQSGIRGHACRFIRQSFDA